MPTGVPLLQFRTARAEDAEEVVALVESAYRGEASRTGWTTEADLLDGQRTDAGMVRAAIGRPGSAVLLAYDTTAGSPGAGRPVGTCHLQRDDSPTAHFGMFAVRPDRQGAGTGRALIDEARRTARSWGCTEMRMTVIRQRTDLIAWYRRLGFRPTGETEPFPYGDDRFGRPRRDDLEFVVLSESLERRGEDG